MPLRWARNRLDLAQFQQAVFWGITACFSGVIPLPREVRVLGSVQEHGLPTHAGRESGTGDLPHLCKSSQELALGLVLEGPRPLSLPFRFVPVRRGNEACGTGPVTAASVLLGILRGLVLPHG